MNKKIIILIIALLLVFGIVGCYGWFLDHNNPNNNEKEINSKEKKDLEDVSDLIIEDSLLKELIDKIPINEFKIGDYEDAYWGKEIQKENIYSTLTNIIVFNISKSYIPSNNYDENEVNRLKKEFKKEKSIVFSSKDLSEILLNNYNVNINTIKSNKDINVETMGWKYIALDNKDNSSVIKKIVYEQEGYKSTGRIEIIEKVVFAVLVNDKYYVYKNTNIKNGQEPVKIIEKDEIDNLESLLVKSDYGKFKHTFMKNNDGIYYWNSTDITDNKKQ